MERFTAQRLGNRRARGDPHPLARPVEACQRGAGRASRRRRDLGEVRCTGAETRFESRGSSGIMELRQARWRTVVDGVPHVGRDGKP